MQTRRILVLAGLVSILSISAYAKDMSAESFVQQASVANEFEIESSNLALQKSQNSNIKSFAQRMVDDHTKTAEKMQQALQSSHSKAEMEDTLDDQHQDLLNQLDAASNPDFDNKYVSMQVAAHKDAVKLFTDYSKHGKNPALKNFADNTLPTLKSHLKHVEELKANH